MIKVITYGTFDLMHHGHIRLLERAKELGDYLIVGVTAEDYDKSRGKINVEQSLTERIENVRSTGLADEIIVEEYEGQKIEDIIRYGVDIFTVGSDWAGQFDYLNEYCQVVYLDRTKGISSTQLREKKNHMRLGLVGDSHLLQKWFREVPYVNGIETACIYTQDEEMRHFFSSRNIPLAESYSDLLSQVDLIYLATHPRFHFEQIQQAFSVGVHVICEAPLATQECRAAELINLAKEKNLALMDAVKTTYATAFRRLILLAKSGKIGKIVSVDATCTSIVKQSMPDLLLPENLQNNTCAWGPTALLPIFQLLGTDTSSIHITSFYEQNHSEHDLFTKIDLLFPGAVASVKTGSGVKSEGELIISGTDGYIYVPAPWWKTDYFELRFEDQSKNKRYFYQLDGEGIRSALAAFVRAVDSGRFDMILDSSISQKTAGIVEMSEGESVTKIYL